MMTTKKWKEQIEAYDDRRDIVIPGDQENTIHYCVEQFKDIAKQSIKENGKFTVALSGGSTPKRIFEELASGENHKSIEWQKCYLFWSDERSVAPDHADSNYRMAMDAGFSKVPIPKENIFRMVGETNIEENALAYEKLLKGKIPSGQFDLVMLGMGEDGHTASLFPKTHGLHSQDRWVVGNFIPEKHTWRMTLTYDCINAARHISIYVLGKSKASMVKRVLSNPYEPNELPIQKVGTPEHKALWILDQDAAKELFP